MMHNIGSSDRGETNKKFRDNNDGPQEERRRRRRSDENSTESSQDSPESSEHAKRQIRMTEKAR